MNTLVSLFLLHFGFCIENLHLSSLVYGRIQQFEWQLWVVIISVVYLL